jgi:hypothetical protein
LVVLRRLDNSLIYSAEINAQNDALRMHKVHQSN